jgi:hypothetical protein
VFRKVNNIHGFCLEASNTLGYLTQANSAVRILLCTLVALQHVGKFNSLFFSGLVMPEGKVRRRDRGVVQQEDVREVIR